jgi:hypothetical protein
MADLRTEIRTACLVPGHVLWVSEFERVASCTIWDITSGGARIVVADSAALPDVLRIKTLFFAKPRPAQVCWRKPKEIGVRFLDDDLSAAKQIGRSKPSLMHPRNDDGLASRL